MTAADPAARRALGGRRRGRLLVSLAILLAFVVLVEWLVGWARLLLAWRALPPAIPAAATLSMLLSHVARGQRVRAGFADAVGARSAACLRLVLQHNLMNNLLPMRSGELVFPVLMYRRFGVRPRVSVPGLLWFRLLDVQALGLLATPALVTLLPSMMVMAALPVWLAWPWLAWRVLRRGGGVAPGAGTRWHRLQARLKAAVPERESTFWRLQGWTLLAWALKLAALVGLLCALVPLSLVMGLLGALGGELTSVLPVHGVAGFGSYEAGVVAATLASGLDTAALLGAAVNLHLFVLGVTLLAGGVAFVPAPAGRDGGAQ